MKSVTEIRCSGLFRPMSCAGYLRFENLPAQETNSAAEEGTAAGEYLAHILLGSSPGTHAKNGVPFDDDMKFYAKVIAEEVVRPNVAGEIVCEQSCDWLTSSGIWIRGSSDISYVDYEGNLCIDDLKYGWGLVEVKDNWQLLGYAIGETLRRKVKFPKVKLRILQPRPHHEDGPWREWVLTYAELLSYKKRIEDRMAQIAQGFSELATGKQCKYCPAAAAHCPAFNRAVFSSIDFVLNHFQQDHLSEKEISLQLDLITRVSEVLKIKKDSLEQLATNRIKEGSILPGWTTVPSYGDRKWKSNINPKVIETLTGKKIIKEEMLSPAQAEKLGIPKEVISKYVDRYFKGLKLKKEDGEEQGNKIFGKVSPN